MLNKDSDSISCPLCKSIDGEGCDALDYAWSETEHLAVLPAWGHLTVGHLLICSKDHIPNLAAANDDFILDVIDTLDSVVNLVKQHLNLDSFVYEHGFNKAERGEDDCSINHIHVHVVPLPEDILKSVTEWISDFPAVEGPLLAVLNKQPEYLLAKSGSASSWRISPPHYQIRSRHFLKLLDIELGSQQRWDEAVVDPRPLVSKTKALLFPEAIRK